MLYLIFLFTILFLLFAWRRLDLAVMFLIAAMPAYLIRFSVFGLPLTILEVMIWLVFLVWLFKSYRYIIENLKLKIGHLLKIENCKLKINNRYPFDWEIVLLLLVAFTAVAVSGFSISAFGIFKAYFFEPVMLFIVVLNILKGEKGRNKILWALAVSALAVSALAVYQKITGQLIANPLWAASETRRVVSFFGYPNAVGLYLGPIVLVMTGWLFSVIQGPARKNLDSRLRGNDKKEIVHLNDIMMIIFIFLTIILSILAIYFAKSKGALLGAAAGFIIFGVLANKKIRWVTIALIIIATAGIAAYRPARDLTISNITLTNLSGQIRKAGWADTIKMLKDGRLLTGAGLANFQSAVEPYHTEGIFFKDFSDPDAQRKLVFNEAYRTAHWQPLEIYLYPHNIFLNFWSELGIAGLLLFIWIIGKYFWMGLHTLSLRGNNINFVIAGSDPQSRNMNDAGTWIPGHRARNALLARRAGARNDRKKQSLAMTDKYIVIGLIGAMVVVVVHGLVDVPYFKNDLAVMFLLFVAIISMINLENKYGEDNI